MEKLPPEAVFQPETIASKPEPVAEPVTEAPVETTLEEAPVAALESPVEETDAMVTQSASETLEKQPELEKEEVDGGNSKPFEPQAHVGDVTVEKKMTSEITETVTVNGEFDYEIMKAIAFILFLRMLFVVYFSSIALALFVIVRYCLFELCMT